MKIYWIYKLWLIMLPLTTFTCILTNISSPATSLTTSEKDDSYSLISIGHPVKIRSSHWLKQNHFTSLLTYNREGVEWISTVLIPFHYCGSVSWKKVVNSLWWYCIHLTFSLIQLSSVWYVHKRRCDLLFVL